MDFNICMLTWDNLQESIVISIELWGKSECAKTSSMLFIIGSILGQSVKGQEWEYGLQDGECGFSFWEESFPFFKDGWEIC